MESSPNHISIIMDGNGRWAKKRGLPRLLGHREGIKTIRKIAPVCKKLGVKYLTLYAFSKENWKRPLDEIQGLMRLLKEFLARELEKICQEGIRLNVIGNIDELGEVVVSELKKAMDKTAQNNDLVLTLAINYGSRQEIIAAANNIICDYKSGKIKSEDINNDLFNSYLYTRNMPDPDLLIRTGGEKRFSNFLLWQSSYCEFYETAVCWPDFSEQDFINAIEDFHKRERRYGGVKVV